jgi:DNA segregation ATPase FtsK/SpoIIIE, S-DNA-T family
MRKKNKKEKKGKEDNTERKTLIPENIKRILIGVVLLLLSLITILGFCGIAGKGGEWTNLLFSFFFGKMKILLPLFFFLSALVYFRTTYENFLLPLLISLFAIITGFSGIIASVGKAEILGDALKNGKPGGWWGEMISSPLVDFVGFFATQAIFLAGIFTGAIILTNLVNRDFSISNFFRELFSREYDIEPSTVKKIFISQEKKEEEKEEKKEEEKKEESGEIKRKFDKKKLLPPLELLHNGDEEPDPGDTRRNASIIKKTFGDFDISVTMGEVNIGPSVTQYTLKPQEGVKLTRITSLSDDLALSLAMHPVRTEAPIPGKSLVGIEVPNRRRAQITLGTLVKKKEYFETSALSFVVGKDVSGNPVYSDLAKMPHMLVAGSTGSGKTIFLNTLILSLLYKNSPDDLRFILVDPKRVEFSLYANLPHLLTPVIYDADKAANALGWLIGEMERRFKVLAGVGSRNILSYRDFCKKDAKLEQMPYIILIVDELADLMANKGNEIEGGIVRIAQMARAVGIHLVLATQRPSVEVITGLIKANITARVSFRVASQVDSRTILDTAGSEKLLGFGDMLFLSTENSKPRRIQAPFVSEEEAKGIVSWLKENDNTGGDDELALNLEESLQKSEHKREGLDSDDDDDALYEDAKQVVLAAGKASASLLQRRLRVGYARAARLLDILENRGIVGPAEGAKPREVYGMAEDQIDIEKPEEEDPDLWDKA